MHLSISVKLVEDDETLVHVDKGRKVGGGFFTDDGYLQTFSEVRSELLDTIGAVCKQLHVERQLGEQAVQAHLDLWPVPEAA